MVSVVVVVGEVVAIVLIQVAGEDGGMICGVAGATAAGVSAKHLHALDEGEGAGAVVVGLAGSFVGIVASFGEPDFHAVGSNGESILKRVEGIGPA